MFHLQLLLGLSSQKAFQPISPSVNKRSDNLIPRANPPYITNSSYAQMAIKYGSVGPRRLDAESQKHVPGLDRTLQRREHGPSIRPRQSLRGG